MSKRAEKRALRPGGDRTTRAGRARAEPMAVVPLGGGRYDVVAADDHVYTVTLPDGTCTCPDHEHRGVRCKHVRRVAIDVTAGRVPDPDQVTRDCAVCGAETFVDAETDPPHFCATHALAPGDRAVDRETGDHVFVVGLTDLRADEVTIRTSAGTVADYPTNADYPPTDPVVAAVYPHAEVTEDGPVPDALRVYSFPASRLRRAD